uniref:Uncharacterized protein n=1 Tax=Steinernema glaseri TaxID=37863 RepID=A0A1I7Y8Y9_9BILA
MCLDDRGHNRGQGWRQRTSKVYYMRNGQHAIGLSRMKKPHSAPSSFPTAHLYFKLTIMTALSGCCQTVTATSGNCLVLCESRRLMRI